MMPYRIRQVWLPEYSFYTSGYFPRNLSRLLGDKVELVKAPNEKVDAEIVGVFSELPNILARRKSFFAQRLRSITGYSFIHGGLNIDVAANYDMKNPPKTTGYGRRIWFTGENIRPPQNSTYDFTIGFDYDDYGGTNIYGPLGHLLLTESPLWIDPILGKSIDSEVLAMPRQYKGMKSQKLACAFIGNNHSVRLRFIEELRKYGEVDIFGAAVGNYVENKLEIAQKYKFVICFENDLFPGYVTEKLIHAYECGTVPLYWGSIDKDEVFNPKSFFNLNHYDSIQEFAHMIGKLSREEYINIYEEPLIRDLRPIIGLQKKFIDIFTNPLQSF
jgi:hypothetical protein